MITRDTVTSPFPVLASVIFFVLLPPTITSPKLTVLGLTESCRSEVMPVPPRPMVSGGVGALLRSERLPVTEPAVLGVKLTAKVMDRHRETLSGTLSPLTLKLVPVTVAPEIIRFPPPGLLTVKLCVFVAPSITDPKVMLEGATDILA